LVIKNFCEGRYDLSFRPFRSGKWPGKAGAARFRQQRRARKQRQHWNLEERELKPLSQSALPKPVQIARRAKNRSSAGWPSDCASKMDVKRE
jgi:hypothetical protein